MGIARSIYYAAPTATLDDIALLAAITAICDEFEAYGWRRVRAALRQQGVIANHKRIRRLMREHGLQPQRRRRFVATTDSDHDGPIFPDRAKDLTLNGRDQLWVADLTYVVIPGGFAYVAVILDAWSRRVVGYAIGRSIDARLALAALTAAVVLRRPLESALAALVAVMDHAVRTALPDRHLQRGEHQLGAQVIRKRPVSAAVEMVDAAGQAARR
ncbi:MAG: IS3 family transposase [Rhodospirillales bacterium]|nr:IS3 family transposase [Rhodospirillales bacterium]